MEDPDNFIPLLDRNKLDSVISSPDSAIDMTEEIPVPARQLVRDIINSLVDEVHLLSRSSQDGQGTLSTKNDHQATRRDKHNNSKNKQNKSSAAHFNTKDMRDCPLTGWRRILARNSDSDGGWGFNFIAPNGYRLNRRELDQFLKIRKLDLAELRFKEITSCTADDARYPRKKAVLTIGTPVEKIRDLRLSKKMELEKRRAKLAQQRQEAASRPQFNSISEYLANLEKEEQDILAEEAENDRSFSTESYLTCQSLVQLCLNSLSYTHTPAWLRQQLPQKFLKASAKSSSELKHESSELHSHSEKNKTDLKASHSPSRSIEKLKIRLGSPDPVYVPPIQKIKITPEKLAKKSKLKNSKSKKRSSEKKSKKEGGGIKVKILTPKSRKMLKYTQKKEGLKAKKFISPTKDKSIVESSPPKKYSFFKSKNSENEAKKEAKKLESTSISPPTAQVRSRSKSMNLSTSYDSIDFENEPSDLTAINSTLKELRKSDITAEINTIEAKEKTTGLTMIGGRRVTRVSSTDARSEIKDISSLRSRSMDCAPSAPVKLSQSLDSHPLNESLNSSSMNESTTTSNDSSLDDSALDSSLASQTSSTDVSNTTTPTAKNDITEDLDLIEDEFSAEQGPLQSPSKVRILASPSKLPVRDGTPPTTSNDATHRPKENTSSPSPSRRLVFGLHSPVCKDEIRLETSHNERKVLEMAKKYEEMSKSSSISCSNNSSSTVKPKAGSRTRSRVISSEDAIKAMDAIINIQTTTTPKLNSPQLNSHNPTPPPTSGSSEASSGQSAEGSPVSASPVTTPNTQQSTSSSIKCSTGMVTPAVTPETMHTPTTPSLPILSPQVNISNPPFSKAEDPHSAMSTPSLPTLSPAIKLPTNPQNLKSETVPITTQNHVVSKSPPSIMTAVKPVGESRRESGEGKLMRPDPDLSQPLSVMIPTPRGQRKSVSAKPRSGNNPSSLEKENVSQNEHLEREMINANMKQNSPPLPKDISSSDTSGQENTDFNFTVKSPPKTPETATGRKMRGCRKFIHYEFSPPFVISDDSSTDQDSPVPVKSKDRPKVDPIPINGELSGVAAKKGKGRPRKSIDSGIVGLDKKRKVKEVSEEKEALNISELAQRLSEDHISPITRERVNYLKLENKNMKRRTSVDFSSLKSSNKDVTVTGRRSVNRSKSTDVKEELISSGQGLEKVKEQLLFSQQLLMKTIIPATNDQNSLETISEEKSIFNRSEIKTENNDLESNARKSNDSLLDSFSGTLFVKKRVRVQSPSDPLAKIKDLVRSNSREDIKTKSSKSQEKEIPEKSWKENEKSAKIEDRETIETKGQSGNGDEGNNYNQAGNNNGQDAQGPSTTRSHTRQGRGANTRKKKQAPAANKLTTLTEDVTLNEDNLVDGLRVLVRIEGHFYPGRLNAINPPDIYGVLLDNERGFKPHIYAREELLQNVIRDVRVSGDTVPLGTRVCAYWSSKYVYLHPGTVVQMEEDSEKLPRFQNVELDDGDSREISIDSLRYLPINYPKVEDGESSMLHSPGKIKRKSHSPHTNRTKEDSPLSANKPKQTLSKDKNDNSKPSEVEKPTQIESVQSKPSQKPALSNDLFAGKIGNIPDPREVNNVPGAAARTGKVMTGGQQEASRVPPTPVSMAGYKKPIEPAASSSGPVDLVGLISKGIDRLVEKKVVGTRPDWSTSHMSPTHPQHSPIHRPQLAGTPQFPHPSFGRYPTPPGTPMHPSSGGGGGMFAPPPPSPQHFPQHYAQPPPSPFHPSQSPNPYNLGGNIPPPSPAHQQFSPPHPGASPSPHSTAAVTPPPPMVYPPYMPPQPTIRPNSTLVPQIPYSVANQEAQSRALASPCPSQSSSTDGENDGDLVLPEPETNRKVASRLSNLIAAVSGKISKPATTLSSPMTTKSQDNLNKPNEASLTNHTGHPTLDKWKSAFDGKGGFAHHHHAMAKQVAAPVVMMEDFEEGFLNVNRMLVGTKILFYKDKKLHPAIISSIEEDDYCITFRAADTQDKVVKTLDKDDLIDKAVLDIPSLSTDKLKTGSRVAVFPVQNCGYLLPGTVRKVINAYLIQVTLDTGPIKDINCDHVKIIPNSFIKKPTYDSKIDLEAFKNMAANNSLINKKKPNILLGYDYVDTDKPDLQNSWEAALSRKSSKRPEKKVEPVKPQVPEKMHQMLPPAPVTLPIKVPVPNSEIKTQPQPSLPISQSVIQHTASLGLQKPLVPVLNPPMAPLLLPPSSLAPPLLPPSSLAPPLLTPSTLAPPLLLPSSLAPLLLPPSSMAPPIHPPSSLAPPLSIPVSSKTGIKAPSETKPVNQTEKKPKTKAPKLSRSKSRESYEEMKRAVKETVNSLVSEVTAEEKMRQSLIIGALKKWSPKKEAARAKSPKNVVKKKKKLKDGERTSSVESSGSDDVTQELLSICKESNINTPNKVSDAERLAWQQSRPPVPPPPSLQPPASSTSPTSKSEVSNESSTQNIPLETNLKPEKPKQERSLDDIVRETMMALANPQVENVSVQEKAETPEQVKENEKESAKEKENEPIKEDEKEPIKDLENTQNKDLTDVSDTTEEPAKSEENITRNKNIEEKESEIVSEPLKEVSSAPTEENSESNNELEVTVDPIQNKTTAEKTTENKEAEKIDEQKEQPDSTENVSEPDTELEKTAEGMHEEKTVVNSNQESPCEIIEDKIPLNNIPEEPKIESHAEKSSDVEAGIIKFNESKEESSEDAKESETITTLTATKDAELISSSNESLEKDETISTLSAIESTEIDAKISIPPAEEPSKKDVYEFDEDQDISPSEIVIKKKKIELPKPSLEPEIKEPTDTKKEMDKSVEKNASSKDTKSETENVISEKPTIADEKPESVEGDNDTKSEVLVNGDSVDSIDNSVDSKSLEKSSNDLIPSETTEPTKLSTIELVKVVPKKKPNNIDKTKPVIKKRTTSFTELKIKKKKLEALQKKNELKETMKKTPVKIDKVDTKVESCVTDKTSEKVEESVKESIIKLTESSEKPIAKPMITEMKQATKNNNEPYNDSKTKVIKEVIETSKGSNEEEIEIVDELLVNKDKAVLARKAMVKRIKEMKKKKAETEISSEDGEIQIVSENITKTESKSTFNPALKLTKQVKESVKPTKKLAEKSFKMVEKTSEPIEKSVKSTETETDKTAVEDASVSSEKTAIKSPPKKKKPKADLKPGHVDENTFYYRDPEFPDNWFIRVNKRSGGQRLKDHYYYTPCRTMLRSILQITKFIKGAIPSQPSKKKFPINYEDMPFKQDLCQEDQDMTNKFEPNFYKLINKKKSKKKPVLTNGTEEHSPEEIAEEKDITKAIEEASKDMSEQKMTDDNCFKIPNEENIRMLRSRRSASSKKDLPMPVHSEETVHKEDDENADSKNNEVDDRENIIVNNFDNNEKITKNNERLDDSITETKPVDDIKQKNEKLVDDVSKTEPSPHSPIKKKLRSNDILSKKKLRSGKLTKSPKKKLLKYKNKKLIRPAVEKLNFDLIKHSVNKTKKDNGHKNSGEKSAESNTVCKQIQGDENVNETKPEEAQEETTANPKDITNNDAQTNKNLASNKRPASPDEQNCPKPPPTKKLKNEESPSKTAINRGPASKRKHSLTSSESEGEEDIISTDNDIHTDINNDNNDISTNDPAVHKCAASLVKVFKQGLMEASCGHCFEAGCYTPESIEIDIPGSIIMMECGMCSWTTVRRISITNKLI